MIEHLEDDVWWLSEMPDWLVSAIADALENDTVEFRNVREKKAWLAGKLRELRELDESTTYLHRERVTSCGRCPYFAQSADKAWCASNGGRIWDREQVREGCPLRDAPILLTL